MYHGELADADGESLSTYFYDLPTTSKRRNVYIHPLTKPGSLRILSLPEMIEASGMKSTPSAFIYPRRLFFPCWINYRTNDHRS